MKDAKKIKYNLKKHWNSQFCKVKAAQGIGNRQNVMQFTRRFFKKCSIELYSRKVKVLSF